MKKKKLGLDSLKVSSFVTTYSKGESQTLKAGEQESVFAECPNDPTAITDCGCLTIRPGATCAIVCP